MKSDRHGFTMTFTLLAIAVVVVIGLVGYALLRHHGAGSNSSQATTSYAGWHDYTLKFEKLKFQYPPNWMVKDDTQPASGKDELVINNPDDTFQISVSSDVDRPTLAGNRLLGADVVTFAGQPAYLDETALTTSPNTVSGSYLSTKGDDPTALFVSKHANSYLSVSAYYNPDTGHSVPAQSLTAARQDANYKIAKQIISSMHY